MKSSSLSRRPRVGSKSEPLRVPHIPTISRTGDPGRPPATDFWRTRSDFVAETKWGAPSGLVSGEARLRGDVGRRWIELIEVVRGAAGTRIEGGRIEPQPLQMADERHHVPVSHKHPFCSGGLDRLQEMQPIGMVGKNEATV